MKLICISDTHNKHDQITIPNGDVLIHTGDFTEGGTKREVIAFLEWFAAQPHHYKIFIAGNHDFYFEKYSEDKIKEIIPENIHYLKESGITLNGIKFWGSPVSPGDGSWAFNKNALQEIDRHWKQIPQDTQILITHTPPYKIMDVLNNGKHIGCASLLKILDNREIKVHIFGHVHNSYGSTTVAGTKFINASILDDKYRVLNEPIVFHLP